MNFSRTFRTNELLARILKQIQIGIIIEPNKETKNDQSIIVESLRLRLRLRLDGKTSGRKGSEHNARCICVPANLKRSQNNKTRGQNKTAGRGLPVFVSPSAFVDLHLHLP